MSYDEWVEVGYVGDSELRRKSELKNHRRRIKSTNSRLALGYEGTLDFNWGYLLALKHNKLITAKEYKELALEFATVKEEPEESEEKFVIRKKNKGEARKALLKAGIITKDGKLSDHYR